MSCDKIIEAFLHYQYYFLQEYDLWVIFHKCAIFSIHNKVNLLLNSNFIVCKFVTL